VLPTRAPRSCQTLRSTRARTGAAVHPTSAVAHGGRLTCRAVPRRVLAPHLGAVFGSPSFLLDRLAALTSLDGVYRVLVHYTYAQELSAQRRQAVCRNRLEGWHSARTRKPTEKATLRSGCGQLPGQHECARVCPAPPQGRPGGAVRVSGNWRLTFAFEGEDAILVDYQDYH
jgi:hypothetical protein